MRSANVPIKTPVPSPSTKPEHMRDISITPSKLFAPPIFAASVKSNTEKTTAKFYARISLPYCELWKQLEINISTIKQFFIRKKLVYLDTLMFLAYLDPAGPDQKYEESPLPVWEKKDGSPSEYIQLDAKIQWIRQTSFIKIQEYDRGNEEALKLQFNILVQFSIEEYKLSNLLEKERKESENK
ncbi:hypothetical protein SBOR_6994 [Sclerotinia borealis F-4128]|uniref:Uncharacterized protein n=1 Tax=Sclerotinia borealis (strain F-4128) TaxID=1432307 RepID=W9C783_SCLBF|nr:hypothetical protein SBOR_6994 [Sclerotinia borealis F-4128]